MGNADLRGRQIRLNAVEDESRGSSSFSILSFEQRCRVACLLPVALSALIASRGDNAVRNPWPIFVVLSDTRRAHCCANIHKRWIALFVPHFCIDKSATTKDKFLWREVTHARNQMGTKTMTLDNKAPNSCWEYACCATAGYIPLARGLWDEIAGKGKGNCCCRLVMMIVRVQVGSLNSAECFASNLSYSRLVMPLAKAPSSRIFQCIVKGL